MWRAEICWVMSGVLLAVSFYEYNYCWKVCPTAIASLVIQA